MNNIQKQILTKLITSDSLRYSELQIKTIENDLFNYHLQYLKKNNLIEKINEKYSLSNFGKIYIQKIDASGKEYDYFKNSVILHVIKKEKVKKYILLQKRIRHPYKGDIQPPSGKIMLGEKIEDAGSRKLLEETGLVGNPKLIGIIRKVRRDKNLQIIEDTNYHILIFTNVKGELKEKTPFGENFWVTFDEARKFEKKNITASKYSQEILNIVEKGTKKFVYFQEELELKNF